MKHAMKYTERHTFSLFYGVPHIDMISIMK
jgi:hypothetical protein